METALIVLDGWGLGRGTGDDSAGDGGETVDPSGRPAGRDAVAAADTPAFEAATERGADGRLVVHGLRVGLPEGQMGNSEVGHLNVGAGRVVKQAYTRISDAIADGSFFENEALVSAFDYAEDSGGRVHLMGLVSDGGVHSEQSHLHALIDLAADR